MMMLTTMLTMIVDAICLFLTSNKHSATLWITYWQKSQADISKIYRQILMLWLLGHFWDHLVEIFLREFLKQTNFKKKWY